VKFQATSAGRANAAPIAHQRSIAKQGGLYSKGIEVSHIAARVPTLENQHLQFMPGEFIRALHHSLSRSKRQASNAILESIDADRFVILIDRRWSSSHARQRADQPAISANADDLAQIEWFAGFLNMSLV
jgi:hypothetical protein